MELKAGYKQTRVGVIPDDWEAERLGKIAEVVMGQSPAGTSYNQDGVGIPLINGPTEFTDKYPIKKQWTTQPTKICRAGDLLLCVRGSSTGRMNISNDEYCIGRGVAAIRAKPGADTTFITFQVDSAIQQLLALSAGSTFPNVDGRSIRSIPVPLPALPEQQAIAAALSDVDALISSLGKLIAKKRDIKQAAMQQLLTGKKRLPGFGGEWEVKRLGDYCLFRSGTGFKESYQGKKSGNYPFIKVSDMNLAGNEIYIRHANNWVSSKDMEALNASPVPPNSIVLAKVGAALLLNRRRITVMETIVDNNMMAAIPKNDVSYLYLYYFLLGIDLGQIAQEGALPSVNANDLGNSKVAIPLLKEQSAITTILSDMDAEIAALERKRDKTRALKQGMMQELLTGRTRLV